MNKRWYAKLALCFALSLSVGVGVAWELAEARPGGGHTFSGGSKSSGGGSKSSGGSSKSSGGSSRKSSGGSSSRSSGGSSSRSKSKDDSGWISRDSSKDDGPSEPLTFAGVVVFVVGLLALFLLRVFGPLLVDLAWSTAVNTISYVTEPIARAVEDRFAPPLSERPPSTASHEMSTAPPTNIQEALTALSAKDHAFSWVLFEDFLHVLYVEAHTARGKNDLSGLVPYLSPSAIQSLHSLAGYPPAPVSTIVVGALVVEGIDIDTTQRRVTVRAVFTSNYTEGSGQDQRSYYVREAWTLVRDADARSRTPERATAIDCPNCGAAFEKIVGGECRYCNTRSEAGSHDWGVERIDLLERETRGPMLTETTEEVGTDLPTVEAPDVKDKLQRLNERDRLFSWQAFTNRVATTFSRFHATWTAQALDPVRPYLSDNLYETQRYWVSAYKAQGLRNVTESPTITGMQLARIRSDKYYDAITVRIYASCRDYTVDSGNRIVAGSREKVRHYTEYWTFIRGIGAMSTVNAEDACPNCGASIAALGQAGICSSCNVKITSGRFDWVLSRIEQDEVYQG